MILQALNAYYERLANDPAQDIAPFGYSRQKISFCVVLNEDGTLHAFQPVVAEVVKGRSLPEQIVVPGQAKPSGSGINPCLLWDNAAYMLGFKPDDNKPERTAETFVAFRDRHLGLEEEIDDPQFNAVCRFLEKWQPADAAQHADLAEMTTSFGLFRVRAASGYVHARPAVDNWWKQQLNKSDAEDDADANDTPTGVCLITGERSTIARLHSPKIKGVRGAQSAGAAVVSFNADAYESYGLEQSYNAPVSEQAAFQYTTALNRLLADDRRTVQLGDTTVVAWTAKPTVAELAVPTFFGGAPLPPAEEIENNEQLTAIAAFLQRLRQGKPADLKTQMLDADVPFYLLGLAPNAARVSVRFWHVSNVGDLSDRLNRFCRELEIDNRFNEPPTMQALLRETAREPKEIPPMLAGGLSRSLLLGSPYPLAFYQAILRRIRVEHFADKETRRDWLKAMHRRAAAVKAVLNRNFGANVEASLQTDRPETSYQLGRWFAVLEKTQKDAQGESIKSTIRHRYYASASLTPAQVFPRLLRMHHHWIKDETVGLRNLRRKTWSEISSNIRDFPQHLGLADQGLFHLGWYQQNWTLYSPKHKPNSTNDESEKHNGTK